MGVACQNVLSIDGDVTVAPHLVDACGLSVVSGACESCIAASCCAELGACAGAANCGPYETCLLGCGSDYACRARCQSDHPVGGSAQAAALDRCVVASCQDACGVGCGQAASFVGGDAAVDCQKCVVEHACSAGIACGESLDCQLITRCASSCLVPDCQWGCFDGHDAGAATFVGLVLAVGAACGPPCNAGANWSCVGKVAWGFAKQPTVSITLNVLDVHQNGVPNASVRACPRDDVSCAGPVASGTTDNAGRVTMVVPEAATGTGFSGYFEITASGFVTTLYFLAWPLTEPRSEVSVLVSTQQSFDSSASGLGITLDPTHGHITAVAQDCFFLGAHDVTVSAESTDDETKERYASGGGISATATQTDSTGYVLFMNVPPRTITLHAAPVATGVESSRVTLFVRAGAMSSVALVPTPR